LRKKLLPGTRYYTYLELSTGSESQSISSLWAEFERVAEATRSFAMRRATHRGEIYPVFRELFRKEAH
jgi:uncharacterized sporulation protein YeaH/YhbH (DUF444 family)